MNKDRAKQIVFLLILCASFGVPEFAYAEGDLEAIKSELRNIQNEIKSLRAGQEMLTLKLESVMNDQLTANEDAEDLWKIGRRGRR